MRSSALVFSLLLPVVTLAQDGGLTGPTSSKAAAGYNCDTTKCQLPNCLCASTSPPGGLQPANVPQFIVFTADDAVQTYTIDAVNQFLAQRKNPNGCPVKMTYFTSNQYTDYSLVTEWYVAGNEIADHTMTHVGSPPSEEINGNLIALNALSGIPMSALKGFRAPFLNYSVDTLKELYKSQFLYDSSAPASVPVTDPDTDAFWPYTLDYGMANNCLAVPGTCKGEPKLPGFWEIPMYAFFDNRGVAGPHLMDPWLDNPNGGSTVDDRATLQYMQKTFTDHYNGNRQPIGLYTHPIHLSRSYPGSPASQNTINMINAFLDWAQQQPNVWIVSNEQLLDWVRNPVPVSQLDQIGSLHCTTPQIDASVKICNGIPKNQDGLKQRCAFSDFPFSTCYGCPTEIPSVANPNPPQDTSGGQSPRFRLPANCSTPFWDPIAGKCQCNAESCAFIDDSRPIGPNGANLTGGGLGGKFDPTSPTASYIPFNRSAAPPLLPKGAWTAMVVATIGVFVGMAGIAFRL
jgi:hypothetical protein